ncbi:MAG: hypothetical protein ACYC0V_19960 [Armatimonadota bacterium]
MNVFDNAIDIDGDGFTEQPASEPDVYHNPSDGVQFAGAQLVFDDPQAHIADFTNDNLASDNPLDHTNYHDPALCVTDSGDHIHHETNKLPHQYGDVDYNQSHMSSYLGADLNHSGMPDSMEVHDINHNMVDDQYESVDVNHNGIPDGLEHGFHHDPTGDLND